MSNNNRKNKESTFLKLKTITKNPKDNVNLTNLTKKKSIKDKKKLKAKILKMQTLKN